MTDTNKPYEKMKKGYASLSKSIYNLLLSVYLIFTLILFSVSAVLFKGMERTYYADCSTRQDVSSVISVNLNEKTNVRITTLCPLEASFLSTSPPPQSQ